MTSGRAAAAAIRGLIDGDGTIVRVLTLNPIGAKVTINNRKHTLEWVGSIVENEIGVRGLLYPVRRSYMYQVIAQDDVVRLAAWLYEDAGPCLARKRDKLMALLAERDVVIRERQAALASQDKVIRERYAAGLEMSVIAQQTGIPLGVVARSRKRQGIHHRKQYRTPNFHDLQSVRGLIAQMSVGEIANRTDFSLATIRKLATNATVAGKLEEEWELVQGIASMRHSGLIMRDIAVRVGKSRNTVAALLLKYAAALAASSHQIGAMPQ